ncbi:ABC transporter permease [Kribbella sp. NPDC056861]|uniref:ABC transporter permease n=1 Tax=Kribbella sp. NPDC056861 TaxID=3154857 RepID=UPI00342FCFB5
MSRPDSLPRYVAARVLSGFGVLGLLSLITFVGVDLLPGDPVAVRLGGTATPERIAELRTALGLDRPVLLRYGRWCLDAVQGDFGQSAIGRPVAELISPRLGNSLFLVLVVLTALVPLSLGLGLLAGSRKGRPTDRVISTVALGVVSVPEFVTAAVLVLIVAVGLRWLPAVSSVPAGESPLSSPATLVLPAISLLLGSLAYAVRMIRAATITALRAPWVEFLLLSGWTRMAVARTTVLPAVLPVAVQVWTIAAVGLAGGTVLVERVFGYPGVGELLVTSTQTGDLPVVQAIVLMIGVVTLVALLVTDLMVKCLWRSGAAEVRV